MYPCSAPWFDAMPGVRGRLAHISGAQFPEARAAKSGSGSFTGKGASGNAVERVPVRRCAIARYTFCGQVHSAEPRMAQIVLNRRLTHRHRACRAAPIGKWGHWFILLRGRQIGVRRRFATSPGGA